MLFPIGDDNRDRKIKPIINYLFVLTNVMVFILLQDWGANDKFTFAFSTVPAEIVSGKDIVTDDQIFEDPVSGERFRISGLQPTPVSVYITLITSMFMHGGIAHIFGNMIFLLVFGDNIENRLGHFRYFLFYLLTGVIAALAHVYTTIAFDGNPYIPTLGASGAVSGVLGAYILLYPTRKVRVIMFYFLTEVPALVAIGVWFVFQLISGIGILGSGAQQGGVAYAAHIGGFIAGFILIKIFAIGKKRL
jgi:membrane associated rhomboid family serine protease